MIEGFFELQTPDDLFQKLRHDLEQMKVHPFDAYLAFNFFITAESMLDWYFPGDENKVNRNELRNSTWFLKATSDLATGAKHFKPRVFHDTVSKAYVTSGGFPKNAYPKRAYPIGSYGNGALIICITDKIEDDETDRFSAFAVATKVLEFWENKLGLSDANIHG